MLLHVPRDVTFDCPEGRFISSLREIRTFFQLTDHGMQRMVRLIFEPELPPRDGLTIVVGKNFLPTLTPRSQLRLFLETWLGKEVLETMAGGKLDLRRLVDQKCQIIVGHYQKPGYKKPFVELQGIYPAPPDKTSPSLKPTIPVGQGGPGIQIEYE